MINNTNPRISFLHYIREVELNATLQLTHLLPPLKILDFGSGDGFIAYLLTQKGFDVVAVDVAPRFPQQYPVIRIGSPKLQFADGRFDFIFSSNVLEHVQDLSGTLSEIRRVLKPNGLAVFTMPTPAWRLYTLLEIPLSVVFSNRLSKQPLYKLGFTANEIVLKHERTSLPKRILSYILKPHGEFPSAMHELVAFSPKTWRRVFSDNGFQLLRNKPTPILTAGLLFPWLFMTLRKKISNRYFASCMAYLVCPNSLEKRT